MTKIAKKKSLPSRKFIYIFFGAIIIIAVVYFVWQKYKYRIVKEKIATTIAKETNHLYIIKYDSLSFDEVAGNAFLKNIHIYPDTAKIKKMVVENMPFVMIDISINSITVKGVATAAALTTSQLIGDSVIIDHPEIILYALKPLNEHTKIENEAKELYKEILGNLHLIDINFVFINNLNVIGKGFLDKEKNFELINGNLKLDDILIDSSHNHDSDRVLFCKQAAFTIDSFSTFNNGRRELGVSNIIFSGKDSTVIFKNIYLNGFENAASPPKKILTAAGLSLTGVNTDAIVKRKNIVVNNVLCKQINFHQPSKKDMANVKINNSQPNDSTGFMRVYSIYMKHLHFPKVKFVPSNKDAYSLGNIALTINDVKADELLKVKNNPMKYTKEIEISVSSISIKSKDKLYDYLFEGIVLNSLKKYLSISGVQIKPLYSETQFAAKNDFQRDRYNVKMRGISVKGIAMEELLDEKIMASDLIIDKVSAKIYRDATKPLKEKSKVGNYLSQLLQTIDMPVRIAHISLPDAYIEYKEKVKLSDSTGVVGFADSRLSITNVTNIPSVIKENDAMNINFDTKVLGTIPLNGNFKFLLGSNEGKFIVNGHISSFDAMVLNTISIPMALIKVNEGGIQETNFHLTGNDSSAKGDFVMKYDNLKIAMLKVKNDSSIKKKGLISLVANLIVKNSNPTNGQLRKAMPSYQRNIYKSFFNLVWKTIFMGMKKIVGIP